MEELYKKFPPPLAQKLQDSDITFPAKTLFEYQPIYINEYNFIV